MLRVIGQFLSFDVKTKKNDQGQIVATPVINVLAGNDTYEIKCAHLTADTWKNRKRMDQVDIPVAVKSWSFNGRHGLTIIEVAG